MQIKATARAPCEEVVFSTSPPFSMLRRSGGMELVKGAWCRTRVRPIEWKFGLGKLKDPCNKDPTIEEQNQNFNAGEGKT